MNIKQTINLTELVPSLKELSYSDKLLLLHFLVAELLKDADLVPLNAENKVPS